MQEQRIKELKLHVEELEERITPSSLGPGLIVVGDGQAILVGDARTGHPPPVIGDVPVAVEI